MKHYQTPAGDIYAFEPDGSQDHLIKPDMVPVSDADLEALRAPKPADQARQELREAESQITLTVLADAILTGNTANLRALYQRINAAKEKIK